MLKKTYKIIIDFIFLFIILHTSVSADDEKYRTTVNNLYDECLEFVKIIEGDRSANHLLGGICVGYIISFRDQIGFIKINNPDLNICIPDDVNNGQLVRVFIKDVRENPKEMNLHRSIGILYSMNRSFPCN